jgi:hypothetical protein
MHHEMTTETMPSESASSRRVSRLRRVSTFAGIVVASGLMVAVPLATAQSGGPDHPTRAPDGQPLPPPDGRMTVHVKWHGQDRTVTIQPTIETIPNGDGTTKGIAHVHGDDIRRALEAQDAGH